MPTPPVSTPPGADRRTTAAILVGMLVPVTALAVMSWLATPTAADGQRESSAVLAKPVYTGPPVRQMKVQVVESYPHDRRAYTQGLVYVAGMLFESTGLEKQSTIRRVDLTTGRVLKQVALAPELFGEGIAAIPQGLVQLTWKNGRGFLYDPEDFSVLRRFSYKGEGWGLCYDGSHLVMSEGTEYLLFRQMDSSFRVAREVRVMMEGQPVPFLNELECVDGSVYANSWRRTFIVKIDPKTGVVTERIDASGLLTEAEAKDAEVLNGIAYDAADGTFLITGKNWPKLFRVRFVPAET